MSMFPGPGAQIYRNEAGEVLGWDYPSQPGEDYDPDNYLSDEPDDPTCEECGEEFDDNPNKKICKTCEDSDAC